MWLRNILTTRKTEKEDPKAQRDNRKKERRAKRSKAGEPARERKEEKRTRKFPGLPQMTTSSKRTNPDDNLHASISRKRFRHLGEEKDEGNDKRS